MPMNIEQSDSRESVAKRLELVRLALGLSKRDFAERAGMSEQAYGPFENGRRDLSLNAAKQIRRTYGIPLEFIYFGNISELPHKIAKEL